MKGLDWKHIAALALGALLSAVVQYFGAPVITPAPPAPAPVTQTK